MVAAPVEDYRRLSDGTWVSLDSWRAALAEAERAERLALFAQPDGFLPWFRYYFAGTERCEDETPDFHYEIGALATQTDARAWRAGAGRRKRGVVLAAPRGHAKTTILTFALCLWWICTKQKQFVVLVGAAAGQAIENAADIRHELESNERLRGDYGNLSGEQHGYRWTMGDFVAVHTDEHGQVTHKTRVWARSPGARMRGARFLGNRPDALLIDDLEDDESVESAGQITKMMSWLNRAAIPMLHPRRGIFIIVGTIIHYDSVLAQLLSPRYADIYVQRTYRAYWEQDLPGGGRARAYLWPGRFSAEFLENERRRLGTLAFSSEYLNDPVDPATRIVQPAWVRWYTGADLEHRGEQWYFQGRLLAIYQAVDPAISAEEQSNADYCAHITIGVTEEDEVLSRAIVVLWVHQDHIGFPDQCQLIIQQYNAWHPQLVAIETVAYQKALKQEMLRRELLPITEVEQTKGTKRQRLTATSAFWENGQVWLRCLSENERARDPDALAAADWDDTQQVRIHPAFMEFYQQAVRYPKVAHDDMFDAFEMATRRARQPQAMQSYAHVDPHTGLPPEELPPGWRRT